MGRNYRINRLTKTDDAALVREENDACEYWQAILSRYLIRYDLSIEDVIDNLS
jgi:hypothetical protein